MSSNRRTLQQREIAKANSRINFYLAGGSRLVYVSRWVVTAIVIVFWLAIWWRSPG
jgi:hypothetical protein